MKPPKPPADRRDSDPLHMTAYRVASEIAKEQYFDKMLGDKQLELAQLATHPDYSRRGAASALLKWGIKVSRKEEWPITLFAGPQGYNLYQRYGFRQVVMVTTKVLDEEEVLDFPGLVWRPMENVTTPEQEWEAPGVPRLDVVVGSAGARVS